MTKAQRRAHITKLIDKWRGRLFLQEWRLDHSFVDEFGPEHDGGGDLQSAAEIHVNYPYKIAKITTYRGFWNKPLDVQEDMLIHELCHCHTQELWDFLGNFANGKHHTPQEVWRSVETLTQRISVIAKYGGR